MVGSRVESNVFMLFTFPLKILGYMVTCLYGQGVHSASSRMKLWSYLTWWTKENWELYIIESYVFSFAMYLQCKSISVSQWRLMLLWCHKDKPKWKRIRGELEAMNLLKKQVAEPVTGSSFLGLIYSIPAGSELLIENEADGLIQWEVPGWPQ